MMFKVSDDYSIFLGKLGFDNENLQSQRPFEQRTITEPIDLSKYVNDNKDFFIYEGGFPAPPCEKKTTFLILTDVMKVTSRQLNNFPILIKNQNRNIQPKGKRKIYTTFRMDEIKMKLQKVENQLNRVKKQMQEKEAYVLKKKLMNQLKPVIRKADMSTKQKLVKKYIARISTKKTKKTSANRSVSTKTKKTNKANQNKKINVTKTTSKKQNATLNNKVSQKKIKTTKNKTSKSAKVANFITNKTKTSVNISNLNKKSFLQLDEMSPITNSTALNKASKASKSTKAKQKVNIKTTATANNSMNRLITMKPKKKVKKPNIAPKPKNTQTTVQSQESNVSSAEKQKAEVLKKLFNKKTSNSETCADEVVPFKLMKLRMKAYDAIKRVNEPHIIQGVGNALDTMPIDNELPKTEQELSRKEILRKYKHLLQTYNESGTSDVDKKNILIQIREIESKLKPYEKMPLSRIDNTVEINQDEFFSFLQLTDKEKNKILENEDINAINQKAEKDNIFGSFVDTNNSNENKLASEASLDDIKKSIANIKNTVSSITRNHPTLIKKSLPKFQNIQKSIDNIQNKILNTNVPNIDPNDLISSNSEDLIVRNVPKLEEYEYELGNNFDVKIFKMLTAIIFDLVKKYKAEDKSLEKKYKYYSKILSPLHFIRVTHANLAQIIKQIFRIDNNPQLNYDQKVVAMTKVINKTIKFQNKIFKISQYKDLSDFQNADIERILNNIYQPNKKDNKPRFSYGIGGRSGITYLIKEILKSLPVVLCMRRKEKKFPKDEDEEDIIMRYTMRDLMKGPVEKKIMMLRFGPKVRNSPKFKNIRTVPGQGRKATSSMGIIDKTEIFGVLPWPEQCK